MHHEAQLRFLALCLSIQVRLAIHYGLVGRITKFLAHASVVGHGYDKTRLHPIPLRCFLRTNLVFFKHVQVLVLVLPLY